MSPRPIPRVEYPHLLGTPQNPYDPEHYARVLGVLFVLPPGLTEREVLIVPRDETYAETLFQDDLPGFWTRTEAQRTLMPRLTVLARPRSASRGFRAWALHPKHATLDEAWEALCSEGIIPEPSANTPWCFTNDTHEEEERPLTFAQMLPFAMLGPRRIRTAEMLATEFYARMQTADYTYNSFQTEPMSGLTWWMEDKGNGVSRPIQNDHWLDAARDVIRSLGGLGFGLGLCGLFGRMTLNYNSAAIRLTARRPTIW